MKSLEDRLCRLPKEAHADFVKTSTGFFGGGATVEDARLIWLTVDENVGVKASDAIATCAEALAMVDAGANTIGDKFGRRDTQRASR